MSKRHRHRRCPKIHKELRAPVRAAMEFGWSLTYTGKHPKLTAPDGYATPVPSNGNVDGLRKAFESRLRKHGVHLVTDGP